MTWYEALGRPQQPKITSFEGLLGSSPQDVLVVWRYAKNNNVDTYSLVQNTEDSSKTPTFRDYEVQVWTGSDANHLLLRRTDYPTIESYPYTKATNMADAGGIFQRYHRFVVSIRDGSNVSLPETVDVMVVS